MDVGFDILRLWNATFPVARPRGKAGVGRVAMETGNSDTLESTPGLQGLGSEQRLVATQASPGGQQAR